jgi:hypothetical protein
MIAAEGDKVVGGGRSFLPMEIGELKVHGRPGLRMWSHAQLRDFGAPGAESLVGDARLLDEDGQVVIEALGLRLRYLDGAARQRTVPGPEDWLYELRWEEIGTEAAQPIAVSAPLATDGSWLLLADGTGVAAALQEQITAADAPSTSSPARPSRSWATIASRSAPLRPRTFSFCSRTWSRRVRSCTASFISGLSTRRTALSPPPRFRPARRGVAVPCSPLSASWRDGPGTRSPGSGW